MLTLNDKVNLTPPATPIGFTIVEENLFTLLHFCVSEKLWMLKLKFSWNVIYLFCIDLCESYPLQYVYTRRLVNLLWSLISWNVIKKEKRNRMNIERYIFSKDVNANEEYDLRPVVNESADLFSFPVFLLSLSKS